MHASRCTTNTTTGRAFVRRNNQRARQSSRTVARASNTSTDLVAWLVSHGGTVNGVELAYAHTADGIVERTLQASRVVAPGETLISVPATCQLRYTGDQSPQLQQLLQQVPKAAGSSHGAWQFKMAIQLLYQLCQGDASPLAAYICHLPGIAPGIPIPGVAMLCAPAVREAFQDPQLAADAEGQWYWCQRFSEEVLSSLPGTPGDPFHGVTITPRLLGWALAVVMSRSFGVRHPGGHVMAPLIDMANHDWQPNAEVQSQEDGRVCMYATQRLEPGQPILLRYGRHSNRDLLLSYGFLTPPPNPLDAYTSPLDVDSTLAAVLQFLGMELPATGRATDGLKTWQRTCLQELGLLQVATAGAGASATATAGTPSSSSSSSSSGGTVAAPAGEAHTETASSSSSSAAAAAAAAATDGDGSGSTVTSLAGEGPAPQQQQQQLIRLGGDPPINAELLALLRVLLCQDRKLVRGKSLEQLGDWSHPVSAAGDALVMKALVGLLTVLYKSSPTTIQQDKQLLVELQQQQQQQQQGGEKRGDASTSGSTSSHDAAQQVAPLAAAAGCALPSKAEQLLVAVEYRLQRKQLLEGVMRSCLLRMKELAAAAAG